jgi:hypothetical protein
MPSPTARTLAYLRRQGFTAGVVERFIAGVGERGQGIRRDFLGCIDLIAVKPGCPILGVQATSVGNLAARLKKARGVRELRAWLDAGAAFQVWGWAKSRGRWAAKIVEVPAGDLADVVLQTPPRTRRKPRHQQTELFG